MTAHEGLDQHGAQRCHFHVCLGMSKGRIRARHTHTQCCMHNLQTHTVQTCFSVACRDRATQSSKTVTVGRLQALVIFGTFLFCALLFFLMCPQSVLEVEFVKQVCSSAIQESCACQRFSLFARALSTRRMLPMSDMNRSDPGA